MKAKRQRGNAALSLPNISLILSILVGLTIAAYWNSRDVPLVFDDLLSIEKNSNLRFGIFSWNLLSARAVLYLTFTLNFLWTGQEVWSYHLVNGALHLINGILIFFVAEHIFRRFLPNLIRARWYALLAAATFLLHPIQTESVTYISSRSEGLSTLFYILGFLIFIKWPEQRVGFLCSALVAVPFLFGLGSKETVISLPATLFLYDFLFLSGASLRPMLSRWRFYLVYLVGGAAAVYYIATVSLRGSIGPSLRGNLSSLHYFLTELRVLVRYVYLIFCPIGLNLNHDITPSTSVLEPAVILSGFFLIALVVVGWLLRHRAPIIAFSIFWFFITVAPTSSFVPIADIIFEHRLYLPMVGICLSFPLLVEFLSRQIRTRFQFNASVPAVSCLLIAAMLVGTVLRNQVWRDEVRLWTDIVSKSPRSERAYNSLAFAHYKKGEYQKAIDAVTRGRELLPEKRVDFADTLGNLYLKTAMYDPAIDLFKENIGQYKEPDRAANAYNNLGVAYLYKWEALKQRRSQMSDQAFDIEREKVLRPAAEAFEKGLELDPALTWMLDAHVNVMHDLGADGELESKAMEGLRSKEDFNNLYTVGKVAFNQGLWPKADEYFERAEKIRQDVKLIYFNHAYALDAQNKKDAAIEKYLMAIRVDPIFIEAHHNVALIYIGKGEQLKALDHLQEVLRYDPKHVNANLNLAKIYALQGNLAAARTYMRTVLEASPGNQEALQISKQFGL